MPSRDAGELKTPCLCNDGPASDQALLADIARGNRLAFAEFYDRFSSRMFGLIFKLVHDRQAAEDVLQEVFLHIWRRAGDYNPGLSSPVAWVMLVTRARAIDSLRRKSAAEHAVDGARQCGGNGSITPPVRRGDEMNRAIQAMAQLPQEQSDPIGLAFHGGLTCVQIADLRSIPVGTVKTRIRLGMRKLRDMLERQREVRS